MNGTSSRRRRRRPAARSRPGRDRPPAALPGRIRRVPRARSVLMTREHGRPAARDVEHPRAPGRPDNHVRASHRAGRDDRGRLRQVVVRSRERYRRCRPPRSAASSSAGATGVGRGRRSNAAYTSPVGAGLAGVDEHDVEHRAPAARLTSSSPLPSIARTATREEERDVRAEAARDLGRPWDRPGAIPQSEAAAASTAAASELPPPRPAAAGIRFSSRMASPGARPSAAARDRAARWHRSSDAGKPGSGAAHQRKARRLGDCDRVAELERGKDGLHVVVAVRAHWRPRRAAGSPWRGHAGSRCRA